VDDDGRKQEGKKTARHSSESQKVNNFQVEFSHVTYHALKLAKSNKTVFFSKQLIILYSTCITEHYNTKSRANTAQLVAVKSNRQKRKGVKRIKSNGEHSAFVCVIVNPKLGCGGLVLGTPCERGVEWCLDVVGARLLHGGRLRICQREAKGQDLSQKPETKHSWLDFRRAM